MTGVNSPIVSEEEIALYDAIERAIANVRAALAEIDRAWVRITGERPNPSAAAFAALDTADEMLTVAREDLARARASLKSYPRTRSLQ
ncbi:hypothetical protein [Ensifer adhaerens]|uniref:hypothetical protein n=1 Tax=Ensifer adhaerens TaxID=106592 RepID=UPI000CF0CE24|nr:hypothetical protein [Ensifer adhaerens]